MCSHMDHTILPANYTMPAFTPLPQSITALWLVLVLPSHGVDLGGWLHTEIKCRLRELNLDTVTHSSTNQAQRRLTLLIETNDVTTTPRRHHCCNYLQRLISEMTCYMSGGMYSIVLQRLDGVGKTLLRRMHFAVNNGMHQ